MSSQRASWTYTSVLQLDEIVELEKTRRRSRLWLPTLPFRKIFIWSRWEPNDSSLEHNEDEDPGKRFT